MIDLETLGTTPEAPIMSIAAVKFELDGTIGDTFYVNILPNEWLKYDRKADGETIKWWMYQSREAVEHLFKEPKMPLLEALQNLKEFCGKGCKPWGNGSNFDISILDSAYRYFNMKSPWLFWNVRDVRTIVELNPIVKKETPFEGVKHNAIDDCIHQIKYVTEIIKQFNNNK